MTAIAAYSSNLFAFRGVRMFITDFLWALLPPHHHQTVLQKVFHHLDFIQGIDLHSHCLSPFGCWNFLFAYEANIHSTFKAASCKFAATFTWSSTIISFLCPFQLRVVQRNTAAMVVFCLSLSQSLFYVVTFV